ncbi:DSD1 family PLP-dependent enzyme [Alcanivorax sp. S6407]|uniref:DSD1 family PLP-dependent enzyme n=1 Tax=Alcanivorax sp. S6407 TaxID=2926424 RepID=UPI001FF6598B|nr:DSD1 family PLP-dependent enzyme [Alcanivorax sp. S6407]MCK0154079.1 DSD1 family PLP-dependent enzyme [Alcanivorax sp. S6407]
MKRRGFLIGLGALAAGGWLLRPDNRGAAHDSYFQAINDTLKDSGPGRPLMLVDQKRLAANCRTLMTTLPAGKAFRIVAKSLPSVPLIQEVMAQTGSQRVMVFHQPFMNALADAIPGCDMLLGKPMPIQAARQFYQELGASHEFDPVWQLQWLVDSLPRLEQYLSLARELDRPMRINVEIDVGLHRGGLSDPQQLDALLDLIHAHPDHLSFSGFMGYDAHVGKLPGFIESAADGHRKTEARYQAFIQRLYRQAPQYQTQSLCFNGAGSPTIALYDDSSVVNELSAGSCLVKAGDFDLPALADFQPAVFIAAPVIKAMDGLTLPGPVPLGEAWQRWDPNRQRTYFIYGGYWKARPESPAGIQANGIYGSSSNQMMYNGSADTGLGVDDQVFFRPNQSEFVLLQFGDLAVWNDQHISGWWPVLAQGQGA